MTSRDRTGFGIRIRIWFMVNLTRLRVGHGGGVSGRRGRLHDRQQGCVSAHIRQRMAHLLDKNAH